jgi:hypothetical protein
LSWRRFLAPLVDLRPVRQRLWIDAALSQTARDLAVIASRTQL